MGLGVLEELVDAPLLQAQVGVVGQQGVERQLEEAVQGAPARVDGGDACGGQHDVLLAHVVADVAQEGRFARAGLPRQEERLAGIFHEVQGVLKLTVAGVGDEGGQGIINN